MHSRSMTLFLVLAVCSTLPAAEPTPGDKMIANYFRQQTKLLTKTSTERIQSVESPEQWSNLKTDLRSELFEMLGLDPLPEKTDLKAVVTGTVEHEEFTVENIHFQSKPQLYVTGNLYLPKNRKKGQKFPTILYVCGHGGVKKKGVSYGNKVHYQHHGAWFARNGYACLTIDTLQLGEIEGIHHGTYKYNEWWWNARGYTSAGVEAWNCIRALDYLETRPEVDVEKMGVTGRSGGGAYSWWITALDDRIQASVPVAGITSLYNHVVDGTVEGHCDCMFHVNTYRWDYPLVAALAAPRPLLISNSDKDRIFPLGGVIDVYSKIRHLYHLHRTPRQLGLQITEGPHKDTQELRIHAFHWFNKHLKGEDPSPLIEMAATPFFEPEQLKVFQTLPEDQINTKIQHSFTQLAKKPAVPKTNQQWEAQQATWKKQLQEKCFRGWSDQSQQKPVLKKIDEQKQDHFVLTHYQFESEPTITLDLYCVYDDRMKLKQMKSLILNIVDHQEWQSFCGKMKPGFPKMFPGTAEIKPNKNDYEKLKKWYDLYHNEDYGYRNGLKLFFAPRGIGPTAWSSNERTQTHIRRRFMQLGQTQDSMHVWDIRRAHQAIQNHDQFNNLPVILHGSGRMAVNAVYASLFESGIEKLELKFPPHTHQNGPIYLNVLRYLDIPQAIAMAAGSAKVEICTDEDNHQPGSWSYPRGVEKQLNWEHDQFRLRVIDYAP